MRIILFKGQSQYDVLRHCVDEISIGFKELGMEPIVLDGLSSDFFNDLDAEIKKGVNFFFCFNAIMSDLKIGSDSIYDLLGVPYITAFGDHPHLHIDRLSNKINRYIPLLNGQSHLDFTKNIFSKDQFYLKSTFAAASIKTQKTDNLNDFKKRSNKILFAGSFRKPSKKTWEDLNNKFLKEFISDVKDNRKRLETIEETITKTMNSKNLELNEKLYRIVFSITVQQIDFYEKNISRLKMIEALTDNGYQVDLYGKSEWDNEISKNKNITRYNPIEVNELNKLYFKYKLVANDNNNFIDGAHERLFNALGSGAQCLSAESTYYNEIFQKEKSKPIFYDRDNIAASLKNIKYFFDNIDNSYNNTIKLQKLIQKEHTWQNRAEEILSIYHASTLG